MLFHSMLTILQAATIIFALIDISTSYWAMAFLVVLFIPGADIAYTVINVHILFSGSYSFCSC